MASARERTQASDGENADVAARDVQSQGVDPSEQAGIGGDITFEDYGTDTVPDELPEQPDPAHEAILPGSDDDADIGWQGHGDRSDVEGGDEGELTLEVADASGTSDKPDRARARAGLDAESESERPE